MSTASSTSSGARPARMRRTASRPAAGEEDADGCAKFKERGILGLPALLSENLLNRLAFPAHMLVADEQAGGYEVDRLADGRRSPLDRYQSVTTNQARTITATFDRLRYANGLALDRGHNFAGLVFSVRGSNDAWTTQQTIWSGTIPSVVTSPGQLDNANGVLTEEGAFLVRYAGQGFAAMRLVPPAIVGDVAKIVGAWLGVWYSPGDFSLPWSEESGELLALEQESPAGWLGRTEAVHRRAGTIGLKLT